MKDFLALFSANADESFLRSFEAKLMRQEGAIFVFGSLLDGDGTDRVASDLAGRSEEIERVECATVFDLHKGRGARQRPRQQS